MTSPTLEFSIVIPTYNRPERLQKCLQSLVQLDYPRDRFEVVVVDDGSKVSLEPVVQPFEADLSIRLIRKANGGPASARNTGAAAAKGTYLAFTDDDCQPHPNWLSAFAAVLAEHPEALVGGYTTNALPDNPYSTASQLLIDYIYDYFNPSRGKANFFASNNFALPRAHYQNLGGFDTNFPLAAGEDREFCDRWDHSGLPMQYAPTAKVAHAHWLTLGSFWKQHSNYGRGAYHFHQIRSERIEESMKVEPLNFYWSLITFPLSKRSNHSSVTLMTLLFLSQVANALGFFKERFSSPKSLVHEGANGIRTKV